MPLNTKIPQQIVSSTTQALSVKRGEPAMLVADMNRGTIVLMDGKTYGGIPAAREDTQIRAGSSAITVNDGEWSALTGTINIGINPEGFIEDVVSPTDKVLAVGDDGKIAAQLSVAYDETSGLFSLKGKDGETISSFTLVIPTGITPKSVALVENPEGQEPGLYLEFVFIDDDDVEIKLYANMDVLKDVYTAGRGITISEDRVISVDEDAISGVIADDLIEENSGLKVVNDKLHLDDHASETPEYGLGDEDNYGHVKLMDAGDNRATVVAGIAATPAAVKDVDDRAVHKEGDETISGVKTFVNTPKVTLSDGSITEVATVDGTVWNKRVDELPEDTDALTENMPIGALVVTNDKPTATTMVVSVMPNHYNRPSLFTSDKTSVTIPSGTQVMVGGTLFISSQYAVLSTEEVAEAGKDVYIYACKPVSGREPVFMLSQNSTVPSGYTAETSRKIGGFHCLCASVGSIADHPLSGYVAGDILPLSRWDLLHKPLTCQPEGMVLLEKLGIWVDIYLQSGTGVNTASVYGATVTDSRSWDQHGEDLAAVGKRMLEDTEFTMAAWGTQPYQAIQGAADPVTTGGKVNGAGRRIISNIGCEDMCGCFWQWIDRSTSGVGTAWADAVPTDQGKQYLPIYALMAGGFWDATAYAGPRCRLGIYSRVDVAVRISSRGAAPTLVVPSNFI